MLPYIQNNIIKLYMANDPKYPFAPPIPYKFVDIDNKYMKKAGEVAKTRSGCSWWPTSAVVVKNDKIIGTGANWEEGKFTIPCPRYEQNYETGKGYHLCKKVCKNENFTHAEVASILDAQANGYNPKNADLYLFGHWWACKDCWNKIQEAEIKQVYLIKNAHKLFTRENRGKMMDKLIEKHKKGEKVSREEAVWKI
jgi:deoxycytidylate deaminase